MNTMALCDRFERDGILQIERGQPLDPHFDDCASCTTARHKYECILAAMPHAEPEVHPPIGWQARVLRASEASEQPARRKAPASRPIAPEIALSFGVAALVIAGGLGVGRGDVAVDVTGEPALEPRVTVLENEPDTILPTPDLSTPESRALAVPTGDGNENAEPPRAPKPVAPAPNVAPSRQEEPAPTPAPEARTEPEARSEAKTPSPVPAPNVAPAPAPSPARTYVPKIVRPAKLYGFDLKYPRMASLARVQGEVSVQCTIRSDGRNTNCRILRGLPFLDEPILQALRASRSDPITVDGRPVDNSDHIWLISIVLRDTPDAPTNSRNVPIVRWKTGL
ncbi:energy transducer TonB [Polyangium sp. y55x31]|uniref:energy transducer TonB n=1 Tax=Polyangium sp. y55x31 TaxID=3042688 RepID=UPI002482DAAA|nr:energy transducer TonB [Polyangium sp. y55x31]MDI1476949.1 TonB family protein [Polyangium sp. y55x31]